jgi:protein-S-isoprenylcysteine O-methyltransferase Ste14
MAKRGFLARFRIVRSDIREDMLHFALPAFLIYCAGLVFITRGHRALLLDKLIHGRLYLHSVQSIVGFALIIIGFTILLVAHFTLWRFYSSTLVIREDHRLITHGIYRFTRHPIYLGVIFGCIGLSLYVSSLYGFLFMSALIPIFLNRIRIEQNSSTLTMLSKYNRFFVNFKFLNIIFYMITKFREWFDVCNVHRIHNNLLFRNLKERFNVRY